MKCSAKFCFLLSVAFAVTCSSADDDCPNKFDKVGGRCIFVATDYFDHNVARTWKESRDLCNSMLDDDDDDWTTDLAAVDGIFLEAFTDYIVESIPKMMRYVFWVGATLADGQWRWTDGSPISNTSYVWVIDLPQFRYESANGLLVPAGEFNRFYMSENKAGNVSPSYVCEAKCSD